MVHTFSTLNSWGLPKLFGLNDLPYPLSPQEEIAILRSFGIRLSAWVLTAIIFCPYLSWLCRDGRGPFDAMGKGEVEEQWAREHHSIWAQEVLGEPANSKGEYLRMKSFLMALVALIVISISGQSDFCSKLVFPAQTQVLHLEMLEFLIERKGCCERLDALLDGFKIFLRQARLSDVSLAKKQTFGQELYILDFFQEQGFGEYCTGD